MAGILIVDDNAANRQYLVTLLGYAGHRLLEAQNGNEALAIVRTEHPELVITDLLMPTMDGYEFVRRLREDPSTAQTRVIFYTATYLQSEARTLAQASGIQDVLVKPAEPQEVLRIVQTALNASAPAPALPLTDEFDREHLRLITDKLAQKMGELERTNVELQRKVQHLAALRAIDIAISSTLDVRVTLNVLLDQVTTQLRVDAADVLLLNPYSHVLESAAARGFRTSLITKSLIGLGEGYAGRVALDRRVLLAPNLYEARDNFTRTTLIAEEGVVGYCGIPLVAKGQVKGVLEIFHRSPLSPDTEWFDFLETLAGQAAMAIDSAELFDSLQRSNAELTVAYDSTLQGWSRALELRDKETEGHTERAAELTVRLARAMGMSEAELVHTRRGALLHDIGKMGIPDAILLKRGPLTEEEWAVMRQHPIYAYELLWPIAYLRPALDIPYCHHEKWDGSGYPRGLKGDQIPLAARIFSAVDVWDALYSDRPYREGWTEIRIFEHIRAKAGTDFDPRVVDAFLRLMKYHGASDTRLDAEGIRALESVRMGYGSKS